MIASMILGAAMVGQTFVHEARNPRPLSAVEKESQARGLAEYHARKYEIEAKVLAQFQLENERLRDQIRTVNKATNVVNYLNVGHSDYDDHGMADERGAGLRSLPVEGRGVTMDEVKRERYLLKGRLTDSRLLYRESRRLYGAEYAIRLKRADVGVR